MPLDRPDELDPLDEAAWEAWHEEQLKAAGERIRASMRDMQARSIIDANGDRISKELPSQMPRRGLMT